MPAKFWSDPSLSRAEITPEALYLSRREFLRATSLAAAGALTTLAAACAPRTATPSIPLAASTARDESGAPLTSYENITGYTNYYEFSTSKSGVSSASRQFRTQPWQVEVYGLVRRPQTFAYADLLKRFPPFERIYRLRCVEGWSMVIPWLGFQLSDLLAAVEPLPEARYVRFESAVRPAEMPGVNSEYFPFPYQEGLRLDEALHPLTLLSTGLYGKELLPQNGAPLRLVVPWKYGFKSIKSIVRIELVAQQPPTFWNALAPHEYGFYANVNPNKAHPRWSQASERRFGETERRPTQLFNGYAAEVASLYTGMDLNVEY